MEYAEWREKLFEEVYPKYEFYHGTIQWKDDQHLIVHWGSEEYELKFDDFYNSENVDPVTSVIIWAYKTLPLLEEEKNEARVYWDGLQYTAVIHRPYEIVHKQTTNTPEKYSQYGNLDGFTWDIAGGMLIIESHIKNIPALTAISHPESLHNIILDYYDITDDIVIIAPYYEPSKVIIGNKKPISRLKDENHGLIVTPITEWLQQINGGTENG